MASEEVARLSVFHIYFYPHEPSSKYFRIFLLLFSYQHYTPKIEFNEIIKDLFEDRVAVSEGLRKNFTYRIVVPNKHSDDFPMPHF